LNDIFDGAPHLKNVENIDSVQLTLISDGDGSGHPASHSHNIPDALNKAMVSIAYNNTVAVQGNSKQYIAKFYNSEEHFLDFPMTTMTMFKLSYYHSFINQYQGFFQTIGAAFGGATYYYESISMLPNSP